MDTFAILEIFRLVHGSVRDAHPSQKLDGGNHERYDTPLDYSFEEVKVIIHNKNEVPMLLGPNSQIITIPDLLKNHFTEKTNGYSKCPITKNPFWKF